ncbi:hypothetical protein GCM10011445_42710 [Pseudocitrobacter faecalis]|uniref:DUF6714 family protein n=1 Tax=Pseudocitrobacter faecalis TaxID=1398493 RepID=UPI001676225F|nr:DUF6714 family protein [Pseudocitrobacter faecalis]GHD97676.1 hypothetical protein GCM10011445_42710 [Pseudocitrobacter faecalis]
MRKIERAKYLRELILKVFDSTEYPGDDNIVLGVYPPNMPDYMAVYNLYKGNKWNSLNDGFFYSHGEVQSSIGFLTPKAFLYYLPAFMLHIISEYWDNNINGLIVDVFSELDYKKRAAQSLIFIQGNEMQLKCVALFLNFILSNSDKYTGFYVKELEEIIEEYWGQLL